MVEGLVFCSTTTSPRHPPPINYHADVKSTTADCYRRRNGPAARPLADAGRVGNQIEGAARDGYERISGMHWRAAFRGTVPRTRPTRPFPHHPERRTRAQSNSSRSVSRSGNRRRTHDLGAARRTNRTPWTSSARVLPNTDANILERTDKAGSRSTRLQPNFR